MGLTMDPQTETYDEREIPELTDEGKLEMIELIEGVSNQTLQLVAMLDRPAVDDDIRVQAIKAIVVHVRTLRDMAINVVEAK